MKANPNDEGLRRYPNSRGFYLSSYCDDIPCTCKESCERKCAGECGCEGCLQRFQEFWSDVPQFIKPDLTLDEERALQVYRFSDLS